MLQFEGALRSWLRVSRRGRAIGGGRCFGLAVSSLSSASDVAARAWYVMKSKTRSTG